MRRFWFALGKDLKTEANRSALARDKTGREYRVTSRAGGRRRRHVASAPGQAHANMFGDLRKSLSWKLIGTHQLDFGYGLRGKAAPAYADAIELGREDGSIAPRPTLRLSARGRGVARAELHWKRATSEDFEFV